MLRMGMFRTMVGYQSSIGEMEEWIPKVALHSGPFLHVTYFFLKIVVNWLFNCEL